MVQSLEGFIELGCGKLIERAAHDAAVITIRFCPFNLDFLVR